MKVPLRKSYCEKCEFNEISSKMGNLTKCPNCGYSVVNEKVVGTARHNEGPKI